MDTPPRRRTWKSPSALPDTLTHLSDAPQCVLWRYGSTQNSQGKFPKIPYTPHKITTDAQPKGTYRGAKTDDAATWGTFSDCVAAANDWRNWFDGAGIVLQPGEVGIDLDHCFDDSGELKPYAVAIIEAVRGRAYIERSVSGSGVHIIVLGHIPAAIKTDDIEIYEGGEGRGRYFTLSGQELAGSARPAPAQDVIDQLVKTHGSQRVKDSQCTRRQANARTNLQVAETVALTAELAAEIRDAESRLPELMRALPSNMTVQLADLYYRGIFPPAMTDTTASGARSVVVAQLHRAPRWKYTDAEIFVMARHIWREKGWEGQKNGSEKALAADAWRLIARLRLGAAPRHKRIYQDAPEPLIYLSRLAGDAVGSEILLTRDERAAQSRCTRATAQRIEEKLVADGLAELYTYALRGQGCKGRKGALRITPAGWQALNRPNESVIFGKIEPSAQNEQVTPSTLGRTKSSRRPTEHVVGDGGARGMAATPPHTHTQPRVPSAADGLPALEVRSFGPWFYATDGDHCGPTCSSPEAARAFFSPPEPDADDEGIDWADIERHVAGITPDVIMAAVEQERRDPDLLWSRGEAMAWHADERHQPKVQPDEARQQTKRQKDAARDHARWAAWVEAGEQGKIKGELEMLRNTVKKNPAAHIWANRRIRELNAIVAQLAVHQD